MLFSSMVFIWVFLPIVIIGYYIIDHLPFADPDSRMSVKNYFLLGASLFFYAWGGIYYLLIMISSIVVNFFGGKYISLFWDDEKKKKKILIITIIIDLGLLFVFKYFNMAVIVLENIIDPGKGSIIGMVGTGTLGLPEIVLPIGISFFTFQAMSYVIDVYRGDVDEQRNLFDFALYVSFFPQLIAGPIVRYHEIDDQIRGRQEKLGMKIRGIKRFCYGLGKKVLLANVFGQAADAIWSSNGEIVGVVAWLGAVCYTLQIYYDFSGYSDMAIGLGRMFGFTFAENFNYPYMSQSIREFWRRWHISLSTWFREYVYIPLGGNRKGQARTLINLFIVFLLTGVWHGANFTFIAWGLYHGIFLVVERLFLGKVLENNRFTVINRIYTLFVVLVGWILFRSDTIYQAIDIIKGLFTFRNSYEIMSYLSMELIICLIVGILLCGPIQARFRSWYLENRKERKIQNLDFAAQMLLLAASIVRLAAQTYNPFIYFQF